MEPAMTLATDCPDQSAEGARLRFLYATSAAGKAEQLLRDHAISHADYLQRIASERDAARCLARWRQPERRAVLIDAEQVGLD
jgi:hypothetical protein